jgi:glutamate 5-kinase
MQTKLRAARLAARSGAATWIVGGSIDRVLVQLAAGADIGTLLLPEQEPLQARKLWLAGNLHVRGKLVIDAGAERVLRQSGRSLLAVGVTKVEGDFRRGDLVAIMAVDGREIARGLCNYSADETRRIKGLASSRFAEVLGYVDEAELIHRDNLVLL